MVFNIDKETSGTFELLITKKRQSASQQKEFYICASQRKKVLIDNSSDYFAFCYLRCVVVLTRVFVHQMAREICHLRQNVYRVLYVDLVKGLSRVRGYLQTNVIKFNLSCLFFYVVRE